MPKPIVYLDSCLIIDLVKAKRNVELDQDRINQAWFTERLIDAAKGGDLRLISSTLILIEASHVSEGMPTPDETKDLFTEFLWSGVIEMIAVDPFVCERARDFRWRDGVVLGNADALHVATAFMENAAEFLSSDEKLKGKLAHLEPVARSNGIILTTPNLTKFLPEKYRSADLIPG